MARTSTVARVCLGFATVGLAAGSVAQAPKPAASAKPAIDLTVLHVQVLLDHLGFGPGVIDGRGGLSTKLALQGFQRARKLQVTGEIDRPTLGALAAYKAVRPIRTLRVSETDVAGPFFSIPDKEVDQAKLPALGYKDALERLAERFHTTPETLAALNPGARVAAGVGLRFPNILPASRAYDAKLKPEWRATLSMLNVSAVQPQADRVVVDKSEGVLKVYDGERLLAQFPATMGSENDPLPIGTWKIQGASYLPPFHYNPALFWDASSKDKKALLPPGPNGPVGIIWLDLNKPHYGIHGTPEPQNIGKSQSHGCIRLTNWDAARLSLMVKPGTKAVFQA